jgi:RNA polymerase sigma factor (sigma-70 family)
MPPDPDRLSQELESAIGRCTGIVKNLARSRGLGASDVDEVFQEVRIRLWQALESGEKIGAVPASYVYRTATSAAIDLIRRRRARREEALEVAHESQPMSMSPNPAPDIVVERTELGRVIFRAVDAIIASRRPVVRMYLLGYKLGEIGQVLGWSTAKTRNLLYRGLEDLRAKLSSLGVRPEDIA